MLLLNYILKFCTLLHNYILNYFYYEQEYSIAKKLSYWYHYTFVG